MFCDWAASCFCVAYADAYVCELMSLFRGKMRPYVQQIVQYDLIWHHMLKTFKRKYIFKARDNTFMFALAYVLAKNMSWVTSGENET